MDRNPFTHLLAGRGEQLPPARGRTTTALRLGLVGLVALAAVACGPAPAPGTSSRATGFPTGDPPAIDLEGFDAFAPREHAIDFIDVCSDPFISAMP